MSKNDHELPSLSTEAFALNKYGEEAIDIPWRPK